MIQRGTTAPAAIGGASARPPPARGRPFPRSRGDRLALLAVAALAILLRAISVAASGGLLGILGYDDGVYFGAATALANGLLPYQDYLLLHPPGLVLALVPFALLGEVIGEPAAFATARAAVVVLGGVNTVLAARVAGRFGRSAGLAAGILYAVWPVVIHTERNTDLHGIQNTLMLLALLVLSRPARIRPGRAALAGAMLGLATAVQLWQGAVVLVVIWWVVVRAPAGPGARLRSAVACGAGAGLAFGAVCLPFLLAAPESMVRQVLLDQVGRPRQGVGFLRRLSELEGLPAAVVRSPLRVPVIAGVAAAGMAVLLVTAWRWPWTRLWTALALVGAAVALAAPSFHADYGALMAPPAVLVLGTGAADVVERLRRRVPVPRLAVGAVAAALALGVGVAMGRERGPRVPVEALTRDVAAARCVTSDMPTLLLLTGTLGRNIERGCPIVIDVGGMAYDTDRGTWQAGMRRRDLPGFQLAMASWFTSGDVALIARIGGRLSPATLDTIRRVLPNEHRRGAVRVWSALP